jgi:hypothetical protein
MPSALRPLASALLLVTVLQPATADGCVARFAAGVEALDTGELDTAGRCFRACLDDGPENPTVAFYLACVAARSGETEDALQWLRRAVAWGYDDAALLAWEPGLEPLHETEAFTAVLECARELQSASDDVHIEWSRGLHDPVVSPDGERLVTVDDGRGFLWEVPTGREIAILAPAGQGRVRFACFTPDGHVVTTGDVGRVWDGRDGSFLHELEGSGFLADIVLAADGAVSGRGIPAERGGAWDVATGRRIALSEEAARARR